MMFLIVICCYRLRQCAVASERKEFTRAQTKTITSLQGQDGAGGFFQCKNDFFGEKTKNYSGKSQFRFPGIRQVPLFYSASSGPSLQPFRSFYPPRPVYKPFLKFEEITDEYFIKIFFQRTKRTEKMEFLTKIFRYRPHSEQR